MQIKLKRMREDSEVEVVHPRDAPAHTGPPLWKSVRLRLCVLCSVGFALVYALRVNLSIAIVAMVKETKHQPINVRP